MGCLSGEYTMEDTGLTFSSCFLLSFLLSLVLGKIFLPKAATL